MPNPINTKNRAKEIHQLWICHYSYKTAWLLSKEVRKIFRAESKERKRKKKERKGSK